MEEFSPRVTDVLTLKTALRVTDVLTHPGNQCPESCQLIAKTGKIVTPQTTLTVISEDPPDNRILECTVEGEANLIVSGDHHLQRLKIYQNIPIVKPIDFLRTLGITSKK